MSLLELGAIDRTDPRPPYQQIADMLRAAIDSGDLEPGAKLPSEAALIEHFGVARMTVRQAVHELRGEGLVIAEHGRGVFVRPMPPVRLLASGPSARTHHNAGKAASAKADEAGYQPGTDRITVSRASAPEAIAQRLGLTPEAEVVVCARRYLANGQPVEIATSYLPANLPVGTPIENDNPGPASIDACLESSGHTFTRFTEEVGARMPTPDERAALDIGPGVPVMTVVRTAYDTEDHAVEVCDTVKVASALLLKYDFPAG